MSPTAPRLARRINAWYRRHARPFPWREPDTTAWGILLIEVMSQQTQIERAATAWFDWIARWPTPADLAAASQAEVLRAWDRLGYPRRALALHRAAAIIAERHDGKVPADLDALLALPGIGPYTAGAVAAFAHGIRTPVVDTNVRRVLARTMLGVAGLTPNTRRDHELMATVLPASGPAARTFNAAAMELGALVCTARTPDCDACPVAALCGWRAAGYPAAEAPTRPQPRFEGSDRQMRGRVMAALRAAPGGVAREELDAVATDAGQLERALTGLLTDGLAVRIPGGYALP
ncbi:MAG TPA: A/G-specific adenine glycosylase [Microbacteriaceae bacterium]|nr:A/G-specific adenine glycosylase [Microbacteriaceae bacterium]